MDSPGKQSYNLKMFTIMKVTLNVTAASSVVTMANCPKASECSCGIMYRAY